MLGVINPDLAPLRSCFNEVRNSLPRTSAKQNPAPMPLVVQKPRELGYNGGAIVYFTRKSTAVGCLGSVMRQDVIELPRLRHGAT